MLFQNAQSIFYLLKPVRSIQHIPIWRSIRKVDFKIEWHFFACRRSAAKMSTMFWTLLASVRNSRLVNCQPSTCRTSNRSNCMQCDAVSHVMRFAVQPGNVFRTVPAGSSGSRKILANLFRISLAFCKILICTYSFTVILSTIISNEYFHKYTVSYNRSVESWNGPKWESMKY